jgi:hypothetical protein
LATDEARRQELAARLKNLVIRTPEGSGSPVNVAGKKFVFPANERKLESIALESSSDGRTVTLITKADGNEQRIVCGHGTWEKGRFAWGLPAQPAAASGAWTADNVYTAKLCFYETPFVVTVQLKFGSGDVALTSEANVGFGATKQPELVGKAE